MDAYPPVRSTACHVAHGLGFFGQRDRSHHEIMFDVHRTFVAAWEKHRNTREARIPCTFTPAVARQKQHRIYSPNEG